VERHLHYICEAMKVIALSCPQCGGSQDVSDDQRLLECRYCRTRLRVERSADGELERLLVESQAENSELLVENRKLEITNEIHWLDRAWAARQHELMVRTKNGEREPSKTMGVLGIIVGCGILLAGLWRVFSPSHEGELLALVGLVAAIMGLTEYMSGRAFQTERNAYLRKYAELSRQFGNLPRKRNRQPSYEDTRSRRRRMDNMSYPAADA
jgi:hypothetical protein